MFVADRGGTHEAGHRGAAHLHFFCIEQDM
jgi:hypothetical protein